MKPSKSDWIHIALIVAMFAIAYWYTFSPKLDLNGDNAKYIELARNMASFHGYSTEGLHGERVIASHFPVGYPAILAFFIMLGLDNLIAFKILNGVFMLLTLILLYFLVRGTTENKPLAFTVSILTALESQLLRFASMAMSEMSFMFFIFLTLFALMMVPESSKRKFGAWFWVAAVSAAACYYLRAVGAAIIFAVLLFYLFRKEWKRAVVSTGTTILCIAPWMIRNRVLNVGRSYINPIFAKNPWRPELGQIESVGEFMQKMIVNLDDTTIKGYRVFLFPQWYVYHDGVRSTTISFIIGFIVLLIVLYGLWRTGKMKFALTGTMLANLGFLLIWNGQNDVRYVTPFIPLVLFGFWNAVFCALKWMLGKIGIKKLTLLLPYALLTMVPVYLNNLEPLRIFSKQPYETRYQQYFDLAARLDTYSPKKDKLVVCCRKEELFKYFAPNTIPVRYLFTKDAKALIMDLLAKDVDYVVLDSLGFSSTGLYLYPAMVAYEDLFTVVWELKDGDVDTYLIEFDKESARKLFASEKN